ncbi:MAG: outer membrane lipoprotein carrier protein LolA, partial [Bacteroidota bacterium]
MRKYYLLALFICTIQLSWAGPPEEVALNLVDKAIGHKNFQATFTYRFQSEQDEASEEQVGSITVQGYQYRLAMGGQEIVSDGKIVWNYLPDAKEVQINDYNPEQGAGTPWPLLTNYRQDYKFHDFQGTQKIGKKHYDIVTVIAEDPNNDLQQIA